jgi:hypothetical protein
MKKLKVEENGLLLLESESVLEYMVEKWTSQGAVQPLPLPGKNPIMGKRKPHRAGLKASAAKLLPSPTRPPTAPFDDSVSRSPPPVRGGVPGIVVGRTLLLPPPTPSPTCHEVLKPSRWPSYLPRAARARFYACRPMPPTRTGRR